jgi:hypothetical protein
MVKEKTFTTSIFKKSTQNILEIDCKGTLHQLTEKNSTCDKKLKTGIHHVSDVRKMFKCGIKSYIFGRAKFYC